MNVESSTSPRFIQNALEQGNRATVAQYFIFWQFTMHYQHFGLPWGSDTFSRKMVSASKEY